MNAFDESTYAELGIDTSKPMDARDAIGLLASAFVYHQEVGGEHPSDVKVQWAKRIGLRLTGEYGIKSALEAHHAAGTSNDPMEKALKLAMEMNP